MKTRDFGFCDRGEGEVERRGDEGGDECMPGAKRTTRDASDDRVSGLVISSLTPF